MALIIQSACQLPPSSTKEALETVAHNKPLYIVGGFGGAARAVYDAIVPLSVL